MNNSPATIKIKTANYNDEVKVKANTNDGSLVLKLEDNIFYDKLAKEWAISPYVVDNVDYSSKYYAQQSKETSIQAQKALIDAWAARDEAINAAEQAAENAKNPSSGFVLKEFSQDDWVYDGGDYIYSFSEPAVVFAVFDGSHGEKTLLTNINIKIGNPNIIMTIKPFDGFVLGGIDFSEVSGFATKEYVNSIVGDIESMLKKINGGE